MKLSINSAVQVILPAAKLTQNGFTPLNNGALLIDVNGDKWLLVEVDGRYNIYSRFTMESEATDDIH